MNYYEAIEQSARNFAVPSGDIIYYLLARVAHHRAQVTKPRYWVEIMRSSDGRINHIPPSTLTSLHSRNGTGAYDPIFEISFRVGGRTLEPHQINNAVKEFLQ